MADSRFIILVVPNANASLRKFKISSVTLFYAIIVLAIFAAIGVGTILQYLRIQDQTEAVRKENAELRASLKKSEYLAKKLNRKISALTRLSARLKAASGMPSLARRQQIEPKAGMGGVNFGQTPDAGQLAMLEQRAEMLEQNLNVLQSYIQTEKPFSTPSLIPTEGFISSSFGSRLSPFTNLPDFHQGIDISGNYGAPVIATAQGKITMAGWFGSFGLTIQIEHENGITTLFGHLSKIYVKPGDQVVRGQKIGLMGNSGMSTAPHLHYEVRINELPVNPKPYLYRAKN
jgi:murein DD-endopeptidase MepM/ murein hydrolase activator NlpD